MLTGFAIILDEDVLYVSNSNKYPSFEIVLFVEKLISSLNPKNFWRLTNILFEGDMGKERMIIRHIVTENDQSLFYCITGDFPSNSEEVSKLMDEYIEKVTANYETAEIIKKMSSHSEFSKVIQLITGYLWDKYRDPIEDEVIEAQCLGIENKIIYCGISAQGLPIISQLYDKSLLNNFHREINDENIELFASSISAKLATITMNTQIRAKTNIKEVHFNDLDDQGCKKIILCSPINEYSLDFIASGDFVKIKEIFNQLEHNISQEQILTNEFAGDLKPFRSLKTQLNEFLIDNF
ncbi:MAG: hypothetical protein EAX91_15765 [Candidatus Lokiarchaeota archaeon]|nr:hypothetical protein [Candidatus Lokiarchaeota archaeon]